jgi:hypothetical protein
VYSKSVGVKKRDSMKGKLAVDLLIEALNRYQSSGGKWVELENKTGTKNLGRLAKKVNEPTLETWLKLHLNLPDLFPAPEYYTDAHNTRKVEIKKFTQTATGTNVNQLHGNGSINTGGSGLRADVLELAKLIEYYWSPKQIQEMIEKLKENQ